MTAWAITLDGTLLNMDHVVAVTVASAGLEWSPDAATVPLQPVYELDARTIDGHAKVLGLRVGRQAADAEVERIARNLAAGGHEVRVVTQGDVFHAWHQRSDPF